ncbi:MAG: alpha/beta fold hydrolase [Myxococcota bacterium]
MSTSVLALLVVGALLLALLAVYLAVHLRWVLDFKPTEVIQVRTVDGHTLPMYRHRRELPDSQRKGVVLCLHGLGASHFNFDFPGSADLAGYLADQGYDVFVPALRGDADVAFPEGALSGWSFDDYVRHDLPAILEKALQVSGARKVHLLGHSMGGLLSYALAAVHGEDGVGSIVAMGSPVGFAEKGAVVGDIAWVEWLVRRLPTVHIRFFARVFAPWLMWMPAFFLRSQFNPSQVDMTYVRRATWHALSHVSTRLLLQFVDWIRHDAFRSVDHSLDYREAMRRITVPVLVIAGEVDLMCRHGNALRALDLVASADKQAVLLGRDAGFSDGYGHIDMVFGMRARDEVFPHITSFLDRVSGAAARKLNGHAHPGVEG